MHYPAEKFIYGGEVSQGPHVNTCVNRFCGILWGDKQ